MVIKKAHLLLLTGSAGCTPCQCGVPGACLEERLPSWLQFLPLSLLIHTLLTLTGQIITVFVFAFISRIILKKLFKNASTLTINTASSLIGSLFVLPSYFYFIQPPSSLIGSLFVLPSVFVNFFLYTLQPLSLATLVLATILVYLGFTVFDTKYKRATLKGSFLGLIVIFALMFLVSFYL